MIGNVLGFALILFLGSFAVGTGLMILKELISRKKRAASNQNKIDEKEVDQSNRT